MIQKTKVSMVAFGIMVIILSANAQDRKYISVNDAIEAASKNNANVKIAELDTKVSNANYKQTDAVFLPQVDVSYTALSSNNPLNAFGFLLQQQSVTAMDFDPTTLNNPGARQDYSARADAKMPLLNLDMVYARKGAKAQEQMYQYKAQRTKEHIAFEVKKAYTQLQFSYTAQRVLLNSLQDVKQIHQSASNFYDQGLIQKSDVLNAQVQVNTIESALAKAESNIQNVSGGLGLLMGADTSDETYLTDSLSQKSFLSASISLSANRSDIMALSKAVEANDMMVKSSKMAFLPRINAFGTYQLNDAKPLGFNANSYLVGINMTWNVFSGNQNKNKVKSAQFQHDKMQEELNLHIKQSNLELEKTRRDLNDLQIEIDKQKASVTQADEALRILTDRYKEGLVNTTDLLMSQAQLSKQQLNLAQSIMLYNITQSYLEFLAETGK